MSDVTEVFAADVHTAKVPSLGLIDFVRWQTVVDKWPDTELAALRAQVAELEARIEGIFGSSRHFDGLTEQELERYAQMSPIESFARMLKLEAQLAAVQEVESVPEKVTEIMEIMVEDWQERFQPGSEEWADAWVVRAWLEDRNRNEAQP